MLRHWILLVFISTVVSFPFAAKAEKLVKFGPYSLQLPDSFVTLEPESAAVELLAHQTGSRFPSLNVLQIVGLYDFDRKSSSLKKTIADSYRQVGLADVHVHSAVLDTDRGFPILRASLTYRDGAVVMQSLIAIMQGADTHFILTLLGPEATRSELAVLFDHVLESIKAPTSLLEPGRSSTDVTQSTVGLYLLPAGGLVVAGLLLLLFRYSDKSERSERS